jgi:predicted nucleic acid-binding protein
MYLGADTGLLIAIANKIPQALELWETIRSGENHLFLSTVSINELLVHFYKRGKRNAAESLIKIAKELKHIAIAPVTLSIAELSAGYRHGLGLPTIDSIILATFMKKKCKRIYTNDSHFKIVKERKLVEVVFINEWIN